MQKMVGKRIFLASPNDMSDEREAVRLAITKFNDIFAWDLGVTYFWRGWEQTSIGVGRPQEMINAETLRDCDYLVLLLGSRWGSPPQAGDGYESGTEEEFFESLSLLADPDAPMRNLFVGFRGVVPDATRDEQLERVLQFKVQLERSKEVMFKVFDTVGSLSDHFSSNLLRWGADTGEKTPISVTLPEREPLLGATERESSTSLTTIAVNLVNAKRFTQAEEIFNLAIASNDPSALLEYSRFLRHSGRYSSALNLNQKLIHTLALSAEADDVMYRAKALANIGIIQRKQGNTEGSLRTLREALEGANDASPDPELQAYIRDNIALTYGQLGKPELAVEQLRASRETRESGNLPVPAGALVNEARAELRVKNRSIALDLVDRALAVAYETAPPNLPAAANALDVRRRALYELNDYGGAITAASECMDINQEIGNSDGIGIAEFGLALALIGAGQFVEAESRARASLDRNLSSGNTTGQASALWAMAQVKLAQGEAVDAMDLAVQGRLTAESAQNTPLTQAIARWLESQSV